ncbi:MAG: Phosphotransferase enzyme family protein, partial [candidate division NC10 bacterium]|nr:Phosphotransferase enzyme family protein [candidate division NC10 bacterium]
MVTPRMSEHTLRQLFGKRFGESPVGVAPLKGDASARRLYRLRGASRTAIGVVGPDDRENRSFLEFSRHFKTCGLPVPEIYAEDLDQGAYLEEDLGDTTLFQFLTANRVEAGFSADVFALYRKVVEILPRFQIEAGRTLNYDVCYPRASFDKQSMMWDLSYFKYYFLRLAKIPFNEQALENDFEWFTE